MFVYTFVVERYDWRACGAVVGVGVYMHMYQFPQMEFKARIEIIAQKREQIKSETNVSFTNLPRHSI